MAQLRAFVEEKRATSGCVLALIRALDYVSDSDRLRSVEVFLMAHSLSYIARRVGDIDAARLLPLPSMDESRICPLANGA